jgi:putative ATP-dependent endonuclease of the OLD family
MSFDSRLKLKISNYKCFGPNPEGYERIAAMNLIIGRNNSGKSTLLDLIDYITKPVNLGQLGHKGETPQIQLESIAPQKALSRVFQENTSGGHIPGNHWSFGQRWIDKPIRWAVKPDDKYKFIGIDPPFEVNDFTEYTDRLAREMGNPFAAHVCKRLLADRDVGPEGDSDSLGLHRNGVGLTNLLQRYLTQVSLPSDLVEVRLLGELNQIFSPDARFARILVQQQPDRLWELFLEEEHKGRIALSHTGSGLKTILLVLAFLHLVPHIERRPAGAYLFGFEELENNLHPALQRRLLTYLRAFALENHAHFFLTTHSSVLIDLFANDPEAQIVHVTHDGTVASARPVKTYVHNREVLDDLDVRASDLLQANGVVWLEGPTDRLYFNRWVELWSGGGLQEGTHYQCVFYGGRLLNHLSASDPIVSSDEAVQILRVNRNALVLIDSDRSAEDTPLNSTKERILKELADFDGLGWVTSGREVENYIPSAVLDQLLGMAESPLGQYEEFEAFLHRVAPAEERSFARSKVLFAERVIPNLTREHLQSALDLGEKLEEACARIRLWNRLPITGAA